MNHHQKHQILQEQERIRADNDRKRKLEEEEERLWATQQEDIRRKQVLLSKTHMKGHSKTLNEIVEFNKLKNLEDKMRDSEMYDQTHDYKVF